MDAAGHVHADRLARFGFDVLQEVDRVGLEERHVGVGVEGVEAAGGVPGRAGGQDERSTSATSVQPIFRQMVKNRGPDDASANDNDAIMRFHPGHP